MKVGSINKTRYSVTPDNIKFSMFCNNQHFQCNTLTTKITNVAGVATLENASVISQLANMISMQNKEAMA